MSRLKHVCRSGHSYGVPSETAPRRRWGATLSTRPHHHVTPECVLRDIDTAANLNIAELFDDQKRLKSILDLPLHVRRAIVSVEVVKRKLTAGDGAQEFVYKVKLIDKGAHARAAREARRAHAYISPAARCAQLYDFASFFAW
jgi:hypothetical protein